MTDKEQIQNHDQMLKLIIIGDTGVGKSCLMKRVMDSTFQEEHQVTIGVEFGSYGVRVDNKVIKVQIWDTAGQESYKSVTRIFYRGAQCVFLTYDVTRHETFDNIADWLKDIRDHAMEEVLIYLVGNKADSADKEVSGSEGLAFAQGNGIHKFFETSAKTGDAVHDVFSIATKDMLTRNIQESQT